MKLVDTIILALGGAFLLIAAYEIYKWGVSSAYWSIMMSVVFYFWYIYRRKR